jgi:F0F1-type ATP synthase gamma subunit
VKARITGTQNIAKITKSMKMVSAAKLRGDQQRLNAARPFAVITYFTLHAQVNDLLFL